MDAPVCGCSDVHMRKTCTARWRCRGHAHHALMCARALCDEERDYAIHAVALEHGVAVEDVHAAIASDAARCDPLCDCACHSCDDACDVACIANADAGVASCTFVDPVFVAVRDEDGNVCMASVGALVTCLRGTAAGSVTPRTTDVAHLPADLTIVDAEMPCFVATASTAARPHLVRTAVCTRHIERVDVWDDALHVDPLSGWAAVVAEGMLFAPPSVHAELTFRSYIGFIVFRSLFAKHDFLKARPTQIDATMRRAEELRARAREAALVNVLLEMHRITSSARPSARTIATHERRLHIVRAADRKEARPVRVGVDAIGVVTLVYLRAVRKRVHAEEGVAEARKSREKLARRFAEEGMWCEAYKTLAA